MKLTMYYMDTERSVEIEDFSLVTSSIIRFAEEIGIKRKEIMTFAIEGEATLNVDIGYKTKGLAALFG